MVNAIVFILCILLHTAMSTPVCEMDGQGDFCDDDSFAQLSLKMHKSWKHIKKSSEKDVMAMQIDVGARAESFEKGEADLKLQTAALIEKKAMDEVPAAAVSHDCGFYATDGSFSLCLGSSDCRSAKNFCAGGTCDTSDGVCKVTERKQYPTWGQTGIPRILHQTSKDFKVHKLWQRSWDDDQFFVEHFRYDDAALYRTIRGDSEVWSILKNVWQELSPVEKADAFRYAVVYLNGGFYADVDVSLERDVESWSQVVPMAGAQESPTDATPDQGGLLLAGYETEQHLTSKRMSEVSFVDPEQMEQWFFAAAPRHPVLKRCLEKIAAGQGQGLSTLQLTGPGVFSGAVHELTSEAKTHSRHLDYKTNKQTESFSLPPHTLATLPNGYQVYLMFTEEVGTAEWNRRHTPAGIEELVRHHYLGSWKAVN